MIEQPELLDYYAVVENFGLLRNSDPTFLQARNLASQAVQSEAVTFYNSYFLNNFTIYNIAKPLKIKDLIGLYTIVAAGFLVGLWVMIAEILYKELQMFMERKTLASGTHYVCGKFYCARVLKVLCQIFQFV